MGRSASFEGRDDLIIKDIISKIDIASNKNFLDVGCGFGDLTLFFIDYAYKNNINLSLVDIDSVIERIIIDERFNTGDIKLYKGVFPRKIPETINTTFDYILAYSVLHYTDAPEKFIESAVSLLNPGGILFLGDLPNINKLGGFMSTEFGRKFYATYKEIDVADVPVYKNHIDFMSTHKDDYNIHLCDELIFNTLTKYRKQGYDVWVLPQSDELPFSNSREDILIKKRTD